MGESSTLVWITGATSGIGAAMARTCPWEGAVITNAARRSHDTLRSIPFDLTRVDTWDRLIEDFTTQLETFDGARAVFVHNAFHYRRSCAGDGSAGDQAAEVTANVVAPLVLGDAFLRAARPAAARGVDVGLVQMSSGAARLAYPGLAVYGAGKAAMEQLVRTVRRPHAFGRSHG